MPTPSQICAAAKLDRDSLNNLRRSPRVQDWPEESSKGFSIRVGLYAALRAAGYEVPTAVAMAGNIAETPEAQRPVWIIRGPLEDREVHVVSHRPAGQPLSDICELVASDKGRIVLVDGPPDPELDAAPQADVVTVINVPSVIRRMESLFECARD